MRPSLDLVESTVNDPLKGPSIVYPDGTEVYDLIKSTKYLHLVINPDGAIKVKNRIPVETIFKGKSRHHFWMDLQ